MNETPRHQVHLLAGIHDLPELPERVDTEIANLFQ
jgi:hypothetical protein